MSKVKRLADLTERERLTYVALLQGESRANQAAGVAWSLAKIFAQGPHPAVLGFAILAVITLGWVIDIAINGG